MLEDTPRPQINSAKIAVGGGIAGAIFTIGSMLIFLTGLPMLWYMFPGAIVLGGLFALILHFGRRKTPGTSWTLPATETDSRRDPVEQAPPTSGPGRSVLRTPCSATFYIRRTAP